MFPNGAELHPPGKWRRQVFACAMLDVLIKKHLKMPYLITCTWLAKDSLSRIIRSRFGSNSQKERFPQPWECE
jgi:hypothetical protein